MQRERPLVVFDIDGTLTETVAVHQTAFVVALERYGITRVNTDWASYPHISDSYIFRANVESHEGRPPEEEERSRFEALFEAAYVETLGDTRITPMPGAPRMLERLERSGAAFCFATGSFRAPAEAKLRAFAGDHRAVLATASDGLSRQEIVGLAIARARARFDVPSSASVVSIGDGLWDLRTAVSLGLEFVGVAQGAQRDHLLAAGATHVVESFDDPAWIAYEGTRFGTF